MSEQPSIYDTNWFTDADQLTPQSGLGAQSASAVAAARKIVADFRKGSLQAFTHLNRKTVADDLDTRLTYPNTFNQGTSWLCGIATFVRVWAFDHPVEYVKLATNLFEKGEGRLEGHPKYGGKLIKPTDGLKTGPPRQDMPQGDWVVLAPIREAFNHVFDYSASEGFMRIKAWNFPGDVVREFQAGGYTRIVNKANGLATAGYDNLMEASSLYEKSWRVILLINSRLLQKEIASPGLINHSDHWIGLNSEVVLSAFGGGKLLLPFTVYSMSGLCTVPYSNQPLPLATFNQSYFGFVAGHV